VACNALHALEARLCRWLLQTHDCTDGNIIPLTQEFLGQMPGACVAYLRGLFDGMQQARIVEDLKNIFCPPPTAETDQLRLIIEGWVRDNPKNLSVSVGWAVPLALSLAFSCPR
jgi:hypothetical protein